MDQSPIRLLQLSDLHVDKGGYRETRKNIQRAIRTYKPDAIIVSGDVRDARLLGEEEKYDLFINDPPAVKALANALSPLRLHKPVILVPGNHDVERARLARQGKKAQSLKQRYSGFRYFASLLYGNGSPDNDWPSRKLRRTLKCQHWSYDYYKLSGVWVLHELRCIIYYVNSVAFIPDPASIRSLLGITEDLEKTDSARHMRLSALSSVISDKNLWIHYPERFVRSLSQLNSHPRCRRYLRLLVTHNPPYDFGECKVVQQAIKRLYPHYPAKCGTALLKEIGKADKENPDARIALILHGDLHVQRQAALFRRLGETNPIYEIGAGWGQHEKDQPGPHLNCITIRRPDDFNLVEVEVESVFEWQWDKLERSVFELSLKEATRAAPLDTFPRIGRERRNDKNLAEHLPLQEFASHAQAKTVSTFDYTMRELLKSGRAEIEPAFLYSWYYEFLPSIAEGGDFYATHGDEFGPWTETGPLEALSELLRSKARVHRLLVVKPECRLPQHHPVWGNGRREAPSGSATPSARWDAEAPQTYWEACQAMYGVYKSVVARDGRRRGEFDLRICGLEKFKSLGIESTSRCELINAAILIPAHNQEWKIGFYFGWKKERRRRVRKLIVTIDEDACDTIFDAMRVAFGSRTNRFRYTGQAGSEARAFVESVESGVQ